MTESKKSGIAEKKLKAIEKMIKSQGTLSDLDNIPFDLFQSYA